MKSPLDMIHIIIIALSEWRNGDTFLPTACEGSLLAALTDQTEVEWQLFLEGCLVNQWVAHFVTFMTNKRCPRRQIQLLISHLSVSMIAMWDNMCKIIHQNDLSNELHRMDNIDAKIMNILQHDTSLLLKSEHLLFRCDTTTIINKTHRFRW